jgi:TatA/E family protein of Tat protein translocase
MDGISLTQIIVIGLIILILFGSNKLPVFGQSLGKAIKGFKQGLNEVDAEAKDVTKTQLGSNQPGLEKDSEKTKSNQNS